MQREFPFIARPDPRRRLLKYCLKATSIGLIFLYIHLFYMDAASPSPPDEVEAAGFGAASNVWSYERLTADLGIPWWISFKLHTHTSLKGV